MNLIKWLKSFKINKIIVRLDINVILPNKHKQNQAKRYMIFNVPNVIRKENMKMVLMSVNNVIMLYMENVLIIMKIMKNTVS